MSCPAGSAVLVVPIGPVRMPTPIAAAKTAARPPAKAATRVGVFMISVADQLVAGLVDGRSDRGLLDRELARDGDGPSGVVDLDVGDAGDGGDLLGDRADAVAAGHAGDGV